MHDSELQVAERIARQAHAGQKEESTGEDYIKHVERVVAFVDSADAKTVAWLHDIIEDTTTIPSDLQVEGISASVINAVVILTRRPWETYAEYIQTIKDRRDELALAVKIADLRDHLRPNCPERLRPQYEKAWHTLTEDQRSTDSMTLLPK